MSGVDVLGVLIGHAIGLRAAPRLTLGQAEYVANELTEVYDAVDELIAFVKDCADGLPECDAGDCRNQAIALLARVGGAK